MLDPDHLRSEVSVSRSTPTTRVEDEHPYGTETKICVSVPLRRHLNTNFLKFRPLLSSPVETCETPILSLPSRTRTPVHSTPTRLGDIANRPTPGVHDTSRIRSDP